MNPRRLRFVAFVILLLTIGCASQSSNSNASGSSPASTEASSPPTSAPTPTPVAANAADITAAAERFIHAWDKNGLVRNHGKGKAPIVFAASFPLHNQNFVDAFDDFWCSGGDINGRIDDTRGPIADITMNYGLPGNSWGLLRAVIHGTLHFVHGSDGWMVDNAYFVGRTFTAYLAPNGQVTNIFDSEIIGPEAIEFHIGETKYSGPAPPKVGK